MIGCRTVCTAMGTRPRRPIVYRRCVAKGRFGADRGAFEDGWASGQRLYHYLAGGGALFDALPLADVTPDDEDTYYADSEFQYARHYGIDVSVRYTEPVTTVGDRVFHPLQSIGDAINNAWGRRQFARAVRHAERDSAPQWRDHQVVPALLTAERLLCDVDGEWLSFWFDGITDISVDLSGWSLAFGFDTGYPLRLRGCDTPWYGVAIAYLTDGSDALDLPELAPLADGADMPPV